MSPSISLLGKLLSSTRFKSSNKWRILFFFLLVVVGLQQSD